MACEDCQRRELADNVDGLEEDVTWLQRVTRNQGLVLVITAAVLTVLIVKLNRKGVLSYAELLDG